MPALPERIVCLTEEPTEVLYALGQEQRIVGISGFTVRPPRARQEKPKVSAFTSAKVDRILALKPDLAIGFSDIQADIAQALIKAGVEVWIANHRSVEQILGYVLRLGAMVGAADRARRYADTLRVAHRPRARQRGHAAAPAARVLRGMGRAGDQRDPLGQRADRHRRRRRRVPAARRRQPGPRPHRGRPRRDRARAARRDHRLVVRQEIQARARGRAPGLCRRAGGARRRAARNQVAADPAARAGRADRRPRRAACRSSDAGPRNEGVLEHVQSHPAVADRRQEDPRRAARPRRVAPARARRHGGGRVLDAQLQGRAGHHRPRRRGAQLAAGAGHRPRGHRHQ